MNCLQYAIYRHFRADGWIYFLVKDLDAETEYMMATDAAIIVQKQRPVEQF